MSMKKLGSMEVHSSMLRKVADADPPDVVPLIVGDWCRLNSGGPRMLVVDVTPACVTCALADGEREFDRRTVRRCTSLQDRISIGR